MTCKYLIDVFETMNNEKELYWTGWLLGCVHIRFNGNYYTSAVITSEAERKLKQFLEFFHSDYPIRIDDYKNYYVDVGSSVFIKWVLSVYGVLKNRPINLISHFIRGYCDSQNGSGFYINKHNNVMFIFSGRVELCELISETLNKNLGINKPKIDIKPKRSRIRYGGNINSAKIYRFLYDNATIFEKDKKYDIESFLGNRILDKFKPKNFHHIHDESNKDKIVGLFNNGMKPDNISNELHIAYNTVKCILCKHDFVDGCLCEPIVSQIVKDYQENGMPTHQLRQKYNTSLMFIGCSLASKEIIVPQAPSYECNHDFFETIDVEEKAYWLGMWVADVTVLNRGRVGSDLQRRDRGHIEKFLEDIESNHIIRDKMAKYPYKDEIRESPVSRFRIDSIKMVHDLIKNGCGPNKSLTHKWPSDEQVPEHLKHHFLRGYSDGDGCWWISKDLKEISYSFRGSKEFCVGAQKWLMAKCGLNETKINEQICEDGGLICMVAYAGKLQVSRIWHLLYGGATVWLDRKKEFEQFIEKDPEIYNKTFVG